MRFIIDVLVLLFVGFSIDTISDSVWHGIAAQSFVCVYGIYSYWLGVKGR